MHYKIKRINYPFPEYYTFVSKTQQQQNEGK